MFESGPKELTQANELIKEGKFEASLELLKEFEEKGHPTLHDIVLCHLIKCWVFLQHAMYKKAVKFAEQAYEESLGLEKSIFSVDALLLKANALININKFEIAEKTIKKGEDLLKTLKDELTISISRRKAFILYLKGLISDPFISPKGEAELALKYYKQGLALAESIGDKIRATTCLLQLSWVISSYKGEMDIALEYAERALAYAKESNYKFYLSRGLLLKALFYHQRGRLSQCIPLYEQSLAKAKELNNIRLISANLNNLASAYRMKGDLDSAIEYSLESLERFSEPKHIRRTVMFYDSLIQIFIDKGDLEQTERYFNYLVQLKKQTNDKLTESIYLFNRALLLKESPRISNRGKAEDILKQLLKDKDIFWELKERVLLTLCELLLSELEMTSNLEVLEEVSSLINELLDTAERSRSYWIWGETFLLQAKLSLLSLDLKEARRLLTQGQKIAEKYGLDMLAMKISNEHDELLLRLSMWENLKESKTSLPERLKLTRLNEQMENMIRKRVIEGLEISNEDPVLLLIVSEGGVPFFSQSFVGNQTIEDHLLGGFFTAINTFINEKFAEGLDRASFGEYTLLMNSISPFLIFYIYKGQSYSAQSRIKSFINELESDQDVWDTFEKFYKLNKEIQLKDIPSLEPLIKEIFIDKSIVME